MFYKSLLVLLNISIFIYNVKIIFILDIKILNNRRIEPYSNHYAICKLGLQLNCLLIIRIILKYIIHCESRFISPLVCIHILWIHSNYLSLTIKLDSHRGARERKREWQERKERFYERLMKPWKASAGPSSYGNQKARGKG